MNDTPFIWAACNEYTKVVKMLLHMGVVPSDVSYIALYWVCASQFASAKDIQLLLDAGVCDISVISQIFKLEK